MFIDCAKLEKILKTDYKTWGVKFGLTKKGMYILNGTGWIIEADNTRITEFLCRVESDYQRMEHEFPSKEEHSKWEEWLRSEAE